MRGLLIIGLLIGLIVASYAIISSQDNNGNNSGTSDLNWNNDFNTALQKAKETNKPIIIDFYANWCGACQQLDEDTFSDPQVIEKLNENYVLLKADIDSNPDLASQYQIYSVPTILIMDSNGQVIKRQEGYLPPDQFLNFI
ncbi:MAG: thioredoxin family protein [Methanomicrobiales archaeon]